MQPAAHIFGRASGFFFRVIADHLNAIIDNRIEMAANANHNTSPGPGKRDRLIRAENALANPEVKKSAEPHRARPSADPHQPIQSWNLNADFRASQSRVVRQHHALLEPTHAVR